jgi:hypothetical protein
MIVPPGAECMLWRLAIPLPLSAIQAVERGCREEPSEEASNGPQGDTP